MTFLPSSTSHDSFSSPPPVAVLFPFSPGITNSLRRFFSSGYVLPSLSFWIHAFSWAFPSWMSWFLSLSIITLWELFPCPQSRLPLLWIFSLLTMPHTAGPYHIHVIPISRHLAVNLFPHLRQKFISACFQQLLTKYIYFLSFFPRYTHIIPVNKSQL